MNRTTAILVNAGLRTVFALQHSIKARSAFEERWINEERWIKVISAAAERSSLVRVEEQGARYRSYPSRVVHDPASPEGKRRAVISSR